jgi:hypothetical protein
MATVKKDLIECGPEVGLIQIEMIIKAKGGTIIRLGKSNKYWHVVYRV